MAEMAGDSFKFNISTGGLESKIFAKHFQNNSTNSL